jgi:hypothetical protein
MAVCHLIERDLRRRAAAFLVMKNLLLALALLLGVMFALGCGSGPGIRGIPPVTGNFSNASLNGSYVYQITGVDISSGLLFQEGGVFTFDGNGHITGGIDDTNGGNGVVTNSSSGTYSISSDGTGSITVNLGSGLSFGLTVTLANSSKIYLELNQFSQGSSTGLLNGAGIAEKQNSTAITQVPSGTFVFRQHNAQSLQGAEANVGLFTISAGAVSGSVDVNRNGVLDAGTGAPLTFTSGSSFGTPASDGSGFLTLIDSSGVTSSYIYYIVDANNIRLLANDTGVIGLGRAEAQTGGPFTNSSISGPFAFGSRGDDSFSTFGVNTVGSFAINGAGTIGGGTFDSVRDGQSFFGIGISGGSYNFTSASGRMQVTLNPLGGVPIQQIFWMVSPSRAFFITNDATKVEDGTASQQSGPFSNSTFNGQFAFLMDGFDSAAKDRVGTIQFNGAGTLNVNEFSDAGGSSVAFTEPGTYSVTSSSSGRTTAVINNISNNFVFYPISSTDAYMLQNDTNVEIIGVMSLQH